MIEDHGVVRGTVIKKVKVLPLRGECAGPHDRRSGNTPDLRVFMPSHAVVTASYVMRSGCH